MINVEHKMKKGGPARGAIRRTGRAGDARGFTATEAVARVSEKLPTLRAAAVHEFNLKHGVEATRCARRRRI
ncbi:MAG: hypothetical protein L6Q92_00185 [Phycisphaerae bacterium]|nr:hypothetical protein [Phycisphaerae bacterium]